MHVLSLDCSGQFTGESLVGAFVDLGIKPSTFEWELGEIDLGDYHLHFDREEIAGVRAVRFGVHGGGSHSGSTTHHRSDHRSDHHDHASERISYVDLQKRVETGNLPEPLKSRSLGILGRLAAARGASAGQRIDQVEFSEADALESLVTTVLACIGLEQLQVSRIYFRQTIQGSGGQAPQNDPGPRTLTVASTSEEVKASPLGAAILAEFSADSVTPPKMKSSKSGCGLGPSGESGGILQATLGEVE
jgi:uncharacterized protein (DUF111 family)